MKRIHALSARAVGRIVQEPPHVINRDIRYGLAGAVGNTPLIKLRKLSEETGCEVNFPIGPPNCARLWRLYRPWKDTGSSIRCKNVMIKLFKLQTSCRRTASVTRQQKTGSQINTRVRW